MLSLLRRCFLLERSGPYGACPNRRFRACAVAVAPDHRGAAGVVVDNLGPGCPFRQRLGEIRRFGQPFR